MSEALTAESLSGPLRSVAERLGMPFVFRLVENFGGTTVAIPSGSAGKKQYRRLCAALGDESASALCREFARRAIYIPNGGRRDKITGARLKAEGVVAGVPDVFLASPRQGFHGLYIEMKRQRGGTVQATQKELITALRLAGYRVEVCKGWWEAREVIENYLTGEIPKGASRRVEPAANQQPLADRRGRRAVQGR